MTRIRIFEVGEQDEQPVQYEEAVGRFRSGQQDDRGNPMSLDEWRVTTGDPQVADAIADLYGGTPGEWETQGEEVLEVLTDTPAVDIILEDGDAIRAVMSLKSSDFKTIRQCDGVMQSEEFGCADCVCPSGLAARKNAAREGTGCKPDIALTFVLADDPSLGKFRYFSGSWTLLEKVPAVQAQLDAVGEPAVVRFGLKRHSFTAKDGTPVSYVAPTLKVLGAAAGRGQ